MNRFEVESTLDHLCKPSLVQLQPNLYAAKFDLMKIVPARYIVEQALKSGALKPGGLVVESSSGTFALGLAQTCVTLGLKLALKTGPVEPIVAWRLRHLGAQIETVESDAGNLREIQEQRFNLVRQTLADVPGSFWPRQHDNPQHPEAYHSIAQSIGETLGKVDVVVATIGSGGSLFGFARPLREANPNLKVIAVDHNLSVIFGPTSEKVYPLCDENYVPLLGMGSDIVFPNVAHAECDEVHWVPVAQMINAVHELHRTTGLIVGPTSGAALSVANWVARNNPELRVLTVFPDHGIRYMNTVYNPQWLSERADELQRSWSEPELCSTPTEVAGEWTWFPWGRRSYEEVLGHPPVSRESRVSEDD
jgi:cysteine synthase A